MTGTALFSPCRRYRYSLWRTWSTEKGFVMFIGLNPSTADETNDDPTIRRCIGYAKDWGYGALCMTNLFAFRATDPADMKREPAPIGEDNDRYLRSIAQDAGLIVAAWGAHGKHLNRDQEARKLVPRLHYLRLTKDGRPGHPLYLPKNLLPILWE